MNRSYNMNNSNINSNNGNTTHIQNNNVQLFGFGKEELLNHLTNKEQKNIINSGNLCLEKLIEITNCGQHNEFKNIVITNVKDNFIYKYDDKLGYFVIANKNDILNELVSRRMFDLDAIYTKLSDADKIDHKTKDKIEKFFEKIQNEHNKFVDENENITYPNYKDYKINRIKILLYNNQDKITKDLLLYFMPE